jgi:hypothetical protein
MDSLDVCGRGKENGGADWGYCSNTDRVPTAVTNTNYCWLFEILAEAVRKGSSLAE